MNSTDIAGAIRRQIISARYALNERLPPERTLAEQYGVARGTVREALRQLEDMGLVRRRAGSGSYVIWEEDRQAPSIVETTRPIELIDARFALEPHMARLAVLHATEADIARAESHLATMESCGGDAEIFADADEKFHLALAECSRNPMLVWFMSKVHEVRSHAQWARMRTLTLREEIIEAYNEEHRAIVAAIRSRDAEAAAAAVKVHLTRARQSLVDVTS